MFQSFTQLPFPFYPSLFLLLARGVDGLLEALRVHAPRVQARRAHFGLGAHAGLAGVASRGATGEQVQDPPANAGRVFVPQRN